MPTFLRLSLVALLLVGCARPALAATTADQLVALSRAGLDDDILIALIETDGSRFVLTAQDILDLYKKGLSNRVIRAMQATARKPRVPPPARDAFVQPSPAPVDLTQASPPEAVPPQAAAPQLIPPPPPQREVIREVVHVPAPAPDVHVTQHVTQRVEVEAPRQRYVETIAVPVYVHAPVAKPEPPVYWGWGGQRRPDSWDDGAKKTDSKKP
jgi:hypothetical protein